MPGARLSHKIKLMMQSPEANDPDRHSIGTDERRREPRYETDCDGEVTNLTSLSPPHPARVVDVSKSGLCFRSDLNVPKGARVKVSFGDTLAFGDVRWCRQLDECWFEAGIALEYTVRKDLVSRIRDAAAVAPPARSLVEPDQE
jgi:PilZ domain-containing protein